MSNKDKSRILEIFVIMPFSETTEKHNQEYWDEFYANIMDIIYRKSEEKIKKLFNASEIKLHRASAPQGNIVKSILRNLKDSAIVISILTDQNPNVFYELGIRHAVSNKTIMLCEKPQKIPFDLANYGVGPYKDNNNKFKHIEKELLDRLGQISRNPDKPDNPYLDFLADYSDTKDSTASKIKVNVVDQIEGERHIYPPKFYRKARRLGYKKVEYEKQTVFAFIIELLNIGSANISIIDTSLDIYLNSKLFTSNTIYLEKHISTDESDVNIRPNYKKKFALEPGKIYQERVAFVLDELIPEGIKEISGKVHIIDMFDKEYISPDIKFIAYS